MQFPKGTLAGYRGRLILSQEVLCDLTSPTVTALDSNAMVEGHQRDFPRGLRDMEIPLSTLWVSGL